MGTNYVWRDRPRRWSRHFDEIHVGKSSAGWSFGFQAWPHRLFNDDWPQWGYDPASPFGFPILSRADWRTVFTTRRGTLWDEYGRQILDPVTWLDGLAAPTAEKIRWEDSQYRGSFADRYPDLYPRDPRDPEGFRFTAGEFS